MAMHFLFFVANLLIAGVLIRLAETKLSGTKFGAALTFAY